VVSIEIRDMSEGELELMLQREKEDRAMFALTEQELEPLKRYIEHRIKPGGFLEAVLCNNLALAAGRADMTNRRKLFDYVEFLYNDAPGSCWGSEENFNAWLEREKE
jgi:hypothetical protein